jgi:hypothetical protein
MRTAWLPERESIATASPEQSRSLNHFGTLHGRRAQMAHACLPAAGDAPCVAGSLLGPVHSADRCAFDLRLLMVGLAVPVSLSDSRSVRRPARGEDTGVVPLSRRRSFGVPVCEPLAVPLCLRAARGD